MRRPNVDIEIAVRMYYEKLELGTMDITQIFRVSRKKAVTLKKFAAEQARNAGVKSWDESKVNTRAAFEAWGLEIADLEKRFWKLKKMEA